MTFPFPGTALSPQKRTSYPSQELKVKSPFYSMLTQSEHAVESNSRMVSSALIDGDAVDDVALAKIPKGPEGMLRGDAEHRGADANAGVEGDNFMVLQFLAKAVDEMNFRADGPLGASGGILNCFYNAFGRADLIGGLGDLEAAFRVGDDANARMLAADALDLLRPETLVHRAVAFSQNS